jgi:hypothetical protein
LTGIPHGYGQSPSAFAASLQAGVSAGRAVVGSLEKARPSAARASPGWEGGAVGSLTPLAAAATGGRPSAWDAREEGSAESAFAFASVGSPPRLHRLGVPVRRRSQTPMRRVGTCSADYSSVAFGG